MFKKISTRSAKFEEMSQDEKLKEIANLIENMLFKDGDYVKFEYDKVCFEYLNNDNITSYRKKYNASDMQKKKD